MYFGSQSVARAVVSWLATVSGEDVLPEKVVLSREASEREDVEIEEAVVKVFG